MGILKSRKDHDHPNDGVTHVEVFKANSEVRSHDKDRQCFWANRVRQIVCEKRRKYTHAEKDGLCYGL